MATRKPTPPLPPKRRPVVPPFQPEPTPFSIRKPRPVVPPFPAQKQTPIDMVRDPGFEARMAEQNYANLMRDQQARLAAQGQYTQGRLMGAPSIQGSPFSRDEDYYNSRYELRELNDLAKKSSGKNKAQIIPTAEIPPKGAIKQNVGSKSINPDYNPEVARKWQEKVRKNLYEQAAKYVPKNDLMALQSKYNDYTSRVPQYVGEGNEPEMTPEQYAEGNKFMEANIARIIAQNPNAKEFLPKPIGSIQGMSKAQQEAIRQFQYNQFITKSREGSQTQNQPPPAPIPQNPQMATYNNLLQQGIQRSNTMNQGAMTDFANMQPGMQATQPATAATPKPVMPIAGMGMQQPKATPVPRKFSTVNTPSARFF